VNYRKTLIRSLIISALLPAWTLANLSDRQAGLPHFQRDPGYEENLRYEASADHTITPAKVFRWIMGLRGNSVPPPSAAEFEPILNVHDSHVRIIAAIAIKF